jgi:hypothetical protein
VTVDRGVKRLLLAGVQPDSAGDGPRRPRGQGIAAQNAPVPGPKPVATARLSVIRHLPCDCGSPPEKILLEAASPRLIAFRAASFVVA